MIANKVFESREKQTKDPWGQWPRLSRLAQRVDQHQTWGYALDLAVPLFGGLATIFSAWAGHLLLTILFAALVVLAESLVVLARAQRHRSQFKKAVLRAQRFVNALHSHLLNDFGDLRVTLLLPFRDETGSDFLRPFLRNDDHTVEGRWLRIGATKGLTDGVAGHAWLAGKTVTAGFAKSYEDCTVAEKQEFCGRMHACMTFLDAVTSGRNPRYVLACLLRVDGENAGVLCIDGKSSANIMGGPTPVTELHGNSTEFTQAQLVEGLVESCCDHLSRRAIAQLYRTSGALTDDDN